MSDLHKQTVMLRAHRHLYIKPYIARNYCTVFHGDMHSARPEQEINLVMT